MEKGDSQTDLPPKKRAWAERRKHARPKAVSVSPDSLFEFERPEGGGALPLVVKPRLPGLSLSDLAGCVRGTFDAELLRHGGLLFRGFAARTLADFDGFLGEAGFELMRYMESATPRTELTEKVYTSTEFPPSQSIALHNELTYVSTWPMKIWFFAVTPAAEGGETPIADVRRVYDRIDPRLRERFERKGWMLVRNFGDGLGLPWQASFHTDDRAEVEDYFRRSDIEFEWKEGDRLRTRQVRPAVVRHPRTGEPVWFNHAAFWHVSSLHGEVREAMLAVFGEDELPYNTYYGDGSKIEESVIEELREAYRQETVAFPWRRGDLLMLDNMLVAHGRNPFSGERRILVAMGEPFARESLGGEEIHNGN